MCISLRRLFQEEGEIDFLIVLFYNFLSHAIWTVYFQSPCMIENVFISPSHFINRLGPDHFPSEH